MRKTATWMTQLDDRILEHLDESGWSTPLLMSQHPRFEPMEASGGRIRERCHRLADADLVAREARGFDITTDGQQYLQGELDAKNRPIPRLHNALRG